MATDLSYTQGAQPVSIVDEASGNALTLSAAGAAKVDGSAVTQPVSGTVTANIGTTNGLALDATLTGGTVKTKIVDTGGTNVASVSAAGAVKVDGSAVTQPVSGTVTANQGTANATPWNENISQWGGTATTLGQKAMTASVPVVIASDNQTKMTPSTISSGNSSTTTLGSNATFTGTYEQVSDYAVITVTVFADQISAVNGLIFDWSSDGVNTDRSEPSSLTNIANGRAFSLTDRAKFFRIRYTNGVSAQGAFRLNTIYHQVGYGHISKPISQSLTDDNFAEPVIGVTYGRLASGTWNPISTPSTTIGGTQPLDVSVHQGNIAAYMASTNGTVNSGTTAATVTSIAYLFHGAGVAKRYEIMRIVVTVSSVATNGGSLNFRLARITAENGAPGGTSQTINAIDQADAASTGTFRTGATGAPTRAAGDYATFEFDGSGAGNGTIGLNGNFVVFDENMAGKPLVVRAGTAEGYEVRSVVGTAITTAFPISVTYYWREV